jgi:hypothetical protein
MGTKMDVSDLVAFFKHWEVSSLQSLKERAARDDFRKGLTLVLRDTARRNGATLTLLTAASWVSIAVGSIGIAGMGTAIGIPLAVLLIPLGLIGGGFLDQDGLLARTRRRVSAFVSGASIDVNKSDTQTEAEAESSLHAQALQLISERVDAISESTSALKEELQIIRESVARLEMKQRQQRVFNVLGFSLSVGICLAVFLVARHS